MDDEAKQPAVEPEVMACVVCNETQNLKLLPLADHTIALCPSCADMVGTAGGLLSRLGAALFRRVGVKVR